MRTIKLLSTFFIVILIALPACLTSDIYFGKTTPPSEQIIHFWNSSEPRSLDPHKTTGAIEANINNNLYESLTTADPITLAPRPGMAERWEAVDQARKWIFYLRHNAKWTDGHAVTAHDFVWSWQRAVNPQTASPYVSMLYYVRNGKEISKGRLPPSALGVRAIDDFTLEVEMEQPAAFFIKMVSISFFAPLPKWTIEQYQDRWTRPENIVTNGPFTLKEHKPYDQIVLIKNQQYWDAANVKLEKAFIYPIDNFATGLNLYKSGEIDTMQSGNIPLPFIKALKNKEDYVKGAYFTTVYFSFNIKRAPFTDARVRKALGMAINKEAITEKLLGRSDLPADAFVPPGIEGYSKVAGPTYSPEQARKLLAEAGFTNGKDLPKVTLYFAAVESNRQIAEAVQLMWKEALNIDVVLQSEEWQTLQARRERRDFDLLLGTWIGDYLDPNTFLDLFATYSSNNRPGWINDSYTKLIEAANAEPDEKQRFKILAQAENLLLDEMPIVPIYHPALSYMKKPFVDGWYANLFDMHPLKYVSINQSWPNK